MVFKEAFSIFYFDFYKFRKLVERSTFTKITSGFKHRYVRGFVTDFSKFLLSCKTLSTFKNAQGFLKSDVILTKNLYIKCFITIYFKYYWWKNYR